MDKITQSYITTYIEDHMDTGSLSGLEDFAKENHVPIIQKDALGLLLFMVGNNRPKRILELGTAIGYSAIAMAMAHEPSTIITVERDPGMKEIAEKNIEAFGLKDRIEVVLSDCIDYLKGCSETFELVFIDAGKSHYKEYLELSLPLLRKNGIIIVDNVLFRGLVAFDDETSKKHRTTVKRLRGFIDHVTQSADLKMSIIPIGDGMAFIRRKLDV
jgi:predicted O-methyltransferase YrrM